MSKENKLQEKRQQKVKKMTKEIEYFSSIQNTCQAVVKPDCSKSTTNKSLGVKKALNTILKKCLTDLASEPSNTDENFPTLNNLLMFNFKDIPKYISLTSKIVVVEFAGAKFKTFANTGENYLKYAATRQKRQSKDPITITHLKEKDEIISKGKFSKKAAISTELGKKTVSNYLGKYLHELDIQANVTVDVDSEAVFGQCECEVSNNCSCSLFTIPVRAVFTKHAWVSGIRKLDAIRQRKGEAEMSQADWLRDVQHDLHDGECVVKYVTSADIDTIVIQLFTVSLYWPRNVDNTFKFPVYVWLQKQKPEIYDITGILTVLEKRFGNKYIGATLAVLLSMGGNDYFH
ncbi:unnamed protein product [Mytilus coruscus]|uniref:Uncharacterized protein n=1 Tax=Mytilus coruscus TaxID=42192 RepID=A0A6J8BH12_MYTCO|nr:unnamed protein product [Mytilus coruscus]